MKLLDPLSPRSAEPARGYPLTKEELRVLAVHWAAVYFETRVACCVLGQTGSTDLRILENSTLRTALIAENIGEQAMETARREAIKLVREKVGEEAWSALTK